MTHTPKKPSLIAALTPIIFLIVFLFLNVKVFGSDHTLGGPNQIVLLLAASLTSLLAFYYHIRWDTLLNSIVSSINKSMPSILILLLIGSLAGTWLLSGVVPAMVYYGLKIIHPKVFLFTAVVVSSLISLATGSSWSTIATIGVALLGIGKALGLSDGLVAGAIISGAYFGDKMSPLSDTTNLAPAVAGTDLFTHIRYMTITTVPSILITLIVFLVIGFTFKFDTADANVTDVINAVNSGFYISPVLLIVPALLIVIIIMKLPPLPSLLIGTILGGVFAVIFQPHIIKDIANTTSGYFIASYKSFMIAMFGDLSISSDNEVVNELFNTSGMIGMLNTVALILAAMIFGGAMEAAGFLRRITEPVVKLVNSTGSLIASTIYTSVFFNITASDQYISIMVPGEMYAETFKQKGLKPEVLSRTLEDGGTLTSVLIPWNTCGATQSRVLGVSVIDYLPYCFFNLINPFVAILMGYLGYKIRRIDGDNDKKHYSERNSLNQ